MKKSATSDNHEVDLNAELANSFWRWFSLSVFVLLVASAIPAFSADVFIDEGDADAAATPVSTPSAPVAAHDGGKAPASEAEVPPAGPGLDLDNEIGNLEPSTPEQTTPVVTETNEKKVNDLMAATPKKKEMKAKIAEKKTAKASKKSSKKVAKNVDKKKKSTASKSKKKSKKSVEAKVSHKSKKSVAANGKKSSKRKVASVKYAGGSYATSSRDCSLESSPGAGDSHGTMKSSRKLWVEDSGNAGYYKVFTKDGSAAYVSKKCF